MSAITATTQVVSTEVATTRERIDEMVRELRDGARALERLGPAQRAELARECLAGVSDTAERWTATGAASKLIRPEDPWSIEELVLGPLMVARFLQVTARALDDCERRGAPELPGPPVSGPDGRLRVPIFPAQGLMDRMVLTGYEGTALMRPGITVDDLAVGQRAALEQARTATVACVLGAGNLTAIGPLDALEKILLQGRTVLLKLHPNFADLADVYRDALAPLVERNLLRICQGGAAEGAYAALHAGIGEVHITGSDRAFLDLAWGSGEEGERRRAESRPRLAKPITGELGNVTPWIVTPGPYSAEELAHQAEHLAGCLMNNAGFNCISPRVLITWRDWPQREHFVDQVEQTLAAVPTRTAWYPGALERYRHLLGEPSAEVPDGNLPWALVRDVQPAAWRRFLEREWFVSVAVEVALDAPTPAEFVAAAAEFANERIAGTLAATLIVHPDARRNDAFQAAVERAIDGLRFGVVGINQWAGFAHLVMTVPWGGYPGATLHRPGSGLGWTHNPYMLDGVEKSVFEGPLVVRPTPLVFPSNRNLAGITRALFDLTIDPGPATLGALSSQASRG